VPETISVVVVDDHPLFRQGVVAALRSDRDLQVVGEADSGEQALGLARVLLPDVMLLDIGMPGWNGIVTAAKVSAACPATAIVMLTSSEDKDALMAAFKAGARAYVLKGVSGRELASVVRAVAAGEVYVSQSLAGEMLIALTQGPGPDPPQELTEREHEILTLIGSGLSNRAIAETIFLSEQTIKHYVTKILEKLHVRNRVQAALLAQRQDPAGR
jgi:two-component system, NarL family, nitrate/nitrite response regulator NarL